MKFTKSIEISKLTNECLKYFLIMSTNKHDQQLQIILLKKKKKTDTLILTFINMLFSVLMI